MALDPSNQLFDSTGQMRNGLKGFLIAEMTHNLEAANTIITETQDIFVKSNNPSNIYPTQLGEVT
jgi:hypothetical protein